MSDPDITAPADSDADDFSLPAQLFDNVLDAVDAVEAKVHGRTIGRPPGERETTRAPQSRLRASGARCSVMTNGVPRGSLSSSKSRCSTSFTPSTFSKRLSSPYCSSLICSLFFNTNWPLPS